MPKKRSDGAAGRKSVRCHTCGKRIRIPEGWTAGPAVRRHYWKQHRERMQKSEEGSR